MRTTVHPIIAFAAVLSVSGCATGGGTDAPATTVSADTTTSVVDDPTTTVAGLATISVTVGTDSGPDRVESVALGSAVKVTIVNPAAKDSFHLHGYDIEVEDVAAGTPATINFTASEPGEFEVESHVTEDVLLVIVVE